jgi:uncharacterized protein (TIGR03118 family)
VPGTAKIAADSKAGAAAVRESFLPRFLQQADNEMTSVPRPGCNSESRQVRPDRTMSIGLLEGDSQMKVRRIVPTAFLAVSALFTASAAHAQYQVTNLVSNQKGLAKVTDPLLVNAWGLTQLPDGPFWISDNRSGWSTLYLSNGSKVPLNVLIPTAGEDGPGSPTGTVFNGSEDFKVKGAATLFLFDTLDGTIAAWAPSITETTTQTAVTTPGASYTGLAISNKPSGNFLFAADNANNKVDIYDGSFALVKSFTDPAVPAGFSVFGIQDFGGLVYVSFASSSGASGGFIDIFGEDGTLLKQLANGSPLNQPWGFAIAPKNFGEFSNTLLVTNNTNTGTINSFNAVTGQFVGTLKNDKDEVIHIDQLWGIQFGAGTGKDGASNQLFFTAGPDNNNAGLFGVIKAN